MNLINQKIIEMYKDNINSKYNFDYNKNLVKFNLDYLFNDDDKILNFINNDANFLLKMLNKCNQYDIIYENNLKNIFFNYMNIIYFEYLKNIN